MPIDAGAGAPFSFRAIVENANDIILVTDANLDAPGPSIVYANAAFTRLTGFAPEEIIGRSPRLLQGPGTSRATRDAIRAQLAEGHDVHTKILNYGKSGVPYWLDLKIVALRDASGEITHFAAIERDVTLDQRRLEELEYLADRDPLTGIPNRRAMLLFAEKQLSRTNLPAEANVSRISDEHAGLCVAYCDIDNFKKLNDTLGHAAGDAVLVGVADRLAENARTIDMVARFGGEEFTVCMPGIRQRDAVRIAERLRWAIETEAFDTPEGPARVTCSIGVAITAPDEIAVSEVFARADAALYRAKTSGRNRVEAAAGHDAPHGIPKPSNQIQG